MTLTRWKLMAGLLALGLGALAVGADDRTDGLQAPAKPKDCCQPAKPGIACPDLPVPPPQPLVPSIVQSPPVAVAEVAPELVPPPKAGAGTPVVPPVPPVDPYVTPARADVPMPPPPPPEPKPVEPVAAPPSVPVTPPIPTVPAPIPAAPSPVEPIPPQAPAVAQPIATTAPAAPTQGMKLCLRMGEGQPRFEIRHGEELLLKVHCEKIDLQPPPEGASQVAGLNAVGKVHFSGPGIDGTCEQLSILSAQGEVLVKGSVQMKVKKGKMTTDVSAEKMMFQLSSVGLVSKPQPQTGVVPTGYKP